MTFNRSVDRLLYALIYIWGGLLFGVFTVGMLAMMACALTLKLCASVLTPYVEAGYGFATLHRTRTAQQIKPKARYRGPGG